MMKNTKLISINSDNKMQKQLTEISRYLFSEKWLFRTLFICLFTYAILRAWLVVPMLDELATFFNYIRTGHYFNTIEHLDANNHILNSFFGHQFYSMFGDLFFLFRLPSLLAFPIYFFSNKYIIQESLPKSSIRAIVFISIVCIPWVFEYFSYSRGYGMAIAFYFAAIALAIKWKSDDNLIFLIGFFICIWLSIVSNLSYFLPSLILLIYVEFLFILNGSTGKNIFYNSLILLLWCAATFPFMRYSFKLKEAGALWWGNQNGLWESTGKSLSKLVLFTDSVWVLYLVLLLILICLISFIKKWVERGCWAYLKQLEAMMLIVFICCLTGIVLMRYLLHVNYPMDRVGMYLAPVFLLLISLFFSKHKITRYTLLGLLFFPLSFIYHLNLSTSIFSPEDRIPNSFANRIKATISDQTALSADHVSHVSYAYSCRKDKKVHIAYTIDEKAKNYGDYHIFWLGCKQVDGYSCIAQHPVSKTCLIQRNQLIQKKVIVDTTMKDIHTADKYFTILKRPIDSVLWDSTIQVEISGDIEFDQPTLSFNIIQTTLNKNNEIVSRSAPRFNWYFSDRTDANFVFTDRVVKLEPEETKFHFFLMNNDFNKIKIKFFRIRIYQIIC